MPRRNRARQIVVERFIIGTLNVASHDRVVKRGGVAVWGMDTTTSSLSVVIGVRDVLDDRRVDHGKCTALPVENSAAGVSGRIARNRRVDDKQRISSANATATAAVGPD